MFGGVKKANISDGAYIFEYELTDIYGLKRRGTAVKANAGGGNIRFEYALPFVESRPPQAPIIL